MRSLYRMWRTSLFIFLCLFICTFFKPITLTHADSGSPSLDLRPAVFDPNSPVKNSYFVFDTQAAKEIQTSLLISNVGSVSGTWQLYSVDATTGQTSGAIYLEKSAPRTGVGNWIKLDTAQVTLAPGHHLVLPFTIHVPAHSSAGQHLGGIVAELVPPTQTLVPTPTAAAIQIKTKSLTIVAVQVDLAGPAIENLQALHVEAGGVGGFQTVDVKLQNSGNMMLKPAGKILITDAQNTLVQDISVKLNTFLPQTTINYPIFIQKKPLGIGTYTADLTLDYGHGKVLHYRASFTISPQQQQHAITPINFPVPIPTANNSSWLTIPVLIAANVVILAIIALVVLRLVNRNKKKEHHS